MGQRTAGERIEVTFRIGERPFLVMPVTVVVDSEDRVAHYLAPGTPFLRRTLRDGSPVPRVVSLEDLVANGSCLQQSTWHGPHQLIVTRPEAAHAVYLRWREPDWTFEGWYVNLQAPLRRTAAGFTTEDQFLDLVVAPNRLWKWKDEDELEHAVACGRLSAGEAAAIRAEGERLVPEIEAGAFPFDGSLLDWRPDPGWTIPQLAPPGDPEDA